MVFDIDKELEKIVGKEVQPWLRYYSDQKVGLIPKSIRALVYNEDRSIEDTRHIREWFDSVAGGATVTPQGLIVYLDGIESYPNVALQHVPKELQVDILLTNPPTSDLRDRLWEATDVYEDIDEALKEFGPKKFLELYYKREIPEDVLATIPEGETDASKVIGLFDWEEPEVNIPYEDMIVAAHDYCVACGSSVSDIGQELESDGYEGEALFKELPRRLAAKGLDCSVEEHEKHFLRLQLEYGLSC